MQVLCLGEVQWNSVVIRAHGLEGSAIPIVHLVCARTCFIADLNANTAFQRAALDITSNLLKAKHCKVLPMFIFPQRCSPIDETRVSIAILGYSLIYSKGRFGVIEYIPIRPTTIELSFYPSRQSVKVNQISNATSVQSGAII